MDGIVNLFSLLIINLQISLNLGWDDTQEPIKLIVSKLEYLTPCSITLNIFS